MKKTLRETQTLRAGCSKAEPKKIRPAADPLPGGAGRPKFNRLEMVTTFTYLQTQFGEDRCTQFRVIVVTDPATHKHTHPTTHPPSHKQTDRTDYNTLRRSYSVQYKNYTRKTANSIRVIYLSRVGQYILTARY